MPRQYTSIWGSSSCATFGGEVANKQKFTLQELLPFESARVVTSWDNCAEMHGIFLRCYKVVRSNGLLLSYEAQNFSAWIL